MSDSLRLTWTALVIAAIVFVAIACLQGCAVSAQRPEPAASAASAAACPGAVPVELQSAPSTPYEYDALSLCAATESANRLAIAQLVQPPECAAKLRPLAYVPPPSTFPLASRWNEAARDAYKLATLTSATEIAAQIDHVDATLARATSLGGSVIMPKFSPIPGVHIALFADPEGHVMGLTEV